MTPKEYIEKYYKEDLARFDAGVLCGATMSKFKDPGERGRWPYLDHFLICQYELNLLSQLIYSHFREDHNKWISSTLPVIDCRCASYHGGVNHPLSILWVAERELSKPGDKFRIPKSLILNYDKYFMDYIKTICSENDFEKLSPERLVEAIKNDPDCNSERVLHYLNKKQ